MSTSISSTNKDFSFAVRKDWKDHEEKMAAEAKKLEPKLGYVPEFEFRVTGEEFKNFPQQERAGNLAKYHLESHVKMLLNDLGDDMVLEGFKEALSNKKIVLLPSGDVSTSYARYAIKDGEFRIEFNPKNFGSDLTGNMSKVNLEKLL